MPYKLVIIVLAFNEIRSLIETIDTLEESTELESTQIVISTSRFAEPGCRSAASFLAQKYPNVSVYEQRAPFVAAAVLEAINLFDSKFIIYMSADKETPAILVPTLLSEIDNNEVDIVSASRWLKGSSFTGYGGLKWLTSKLAQWTCKLIYLSRLKEFTYGFRIYKSEILKKCVFLESKHPFFLESLLVPMRLGYKIQEIPVDWVPRTEGKSVVTLKTLLSYVWPIIHVRVRNRMKLVCQYPKQISI